MRFPDSDFPHTSSLPAAALPQLRRDLRRQRRQLDARTRLQAGHAIARRLCRHPLWRGQIHVGLYLPAFGEVPILPLARQLCRQHCRLYLPVVRRLDQRLVFVPTSIQQLAQRQRLIRHPLGMLQPASGRGRPVQQLDVLILPLLAADHRGARLGMGGGYYDRTLGQPARRCRTRPLRIGVGYGFQLLPCPLPTAPWDQPLHHLVTPTRHLIFAATGGTVTN